MPWIITAAIVLVALIFLSQLWRFGGKQDKEYELLRLCRGDREKFEQLVADQLQQRPFIPRDQAIQRAIVQLSREPQ